MAEASSKGKVGDDERALARSGGRLFAITAYCTICSWRPGRRNWRSRRARYPARRGSRFPNPPALSSSAPQRAAARARGGGGAALTGLPYHTQAASGPRIQAIRTMPSTVTPTLWTRSRRARPAGLAALHRAPRHLPARPCELFVIEQRQEHATMTAPDDSKRKATAQRRCSRSFLLEVEPSVSLQGFLLTPDSGSNRRLTAVPVRPNL
jgi:hypothetical protein